jgi:chromosome segregation ATPase
VDLKSLVIMQTEIKLKILKNFFDENILEIGRLTGEDVDQKIPDPVSKIKSPTKEPTVSSEILEKSGLDLQQYASELPTKEPTVSSEKLEKSGLNLEQNESKLPTKEPTVSTEELEKSGLDLEQNTSEQLPQVEKVETVVNLLDEIKALKMKNTDLQNQLQENKDQIDQKPTETVLRLQSRIENYLNELENVSNSSQQPKQEPEPKEQQSQKPEEQQQQEPVDLQNQQLLVEIEKYKSTSTVLQEVVDSLNATNEKLNSENVALTQTNDLVKSELSNQVSQIESLKLESEVLAKALTEKDFQIEKLKNESEAIKLKFANQDCQIEVQKFELEELKRKLIEKDCETDKLKIEIETSKIRIGQQDCQIETQKLQLEAAAKTWSKQDLQIKDCKQTITVQDGKLKDQTLTIEKLSDQHCQLKTRKQEMDLNMKAAKARMEEQEKETAKLAKLVESQKINLEENIDETIRKEKEIQTMTDKFNSEVTTLEIEIEIQKSQLLKQNSEMDFLKQDLNSFKVENENLSNQLVRLQNLSEANEREICQQKVEIKKQILEFGECKTQIFKKDQEIELLNKKLDFAKNHLTLQKKEITSTKQVSSAKEEKLLKEIEEKMKKIVELKNHLDQIKAAFRQKDSEVKSLKQEMNLVAENYKSEIQNCKLQLEAKEKQIKEQKADIEKILLSLLKEKTDETKAKQINELKTKLVKLSAELNSCKEAIQLSGVEVSNLNKTITGKMTMIQQLSNQRNQIMSELKTLEMRLKESVKENSNLRSAFKECLNRDEAVTLAASKRIRALRSAVQAILNVS